MKKSILLLLFISCTAVMVAQEQPTKISTEINAVVDNVFDNTTEVVKQLADALKVPAEHVYAVLVKQQIVKGISISAGCFVSLIVFLLSVWILHKKINPDKPWYYQNNEGYWTICILTGMVLVALLGVLIGVGIPSLLNPEYGAIKEIMELL